MENCKTKFKVIQKINKIFIDLILIVFYFGVIGFGYLIYQMLQAFNKTVKNKNTYWQESEKKEINADYFQSPY